MHDAGAADRVRFGPFELDVRSGELYKGPTRLKVPAQSIEILKALLEQPGQLVTREDLRQRLWPDNTFVDFEHGLNAAVSRLREVFGIPLTRRDSLRRCPGEGTGSSGQSTLGCMAEFRRLHDRMRSITQLSQTHKANAQLLTG